MSISSAAKNIFLGIAYVLIAIILLFLVDLGLSYFLTHIVAYVFDWFNGISIFFKLFLILVGGFSLFAGLLQLTQRVSTILGGLIFNKFPDNPIASAIAMLIAIANAIWNIIWLWRVPFHYNFWVVCELLIMSFFIWSLCAIVLPAREQIEQFKKEDSY
jgi:hypothetical protein